MVPLEKMDRCGRYVCLLGCSLLILYYPETTNAGFVVFGAPVSYHKHEPVFLGLMYTTEDADR